MKKNYQHYIPAVYLRQFQIDNKNQKSKVYCVDLEKQAVSIEIKGAGNKDFTLYQYYNDDRLSKIDGLEDAFDKGFESKYNDIIKAVNAGESIDDMTKQKLISWLWLSQFRSPFKREQIRHELDLRHFWLKVSEPNKLPDVTQEELQECLEIASKTIHLNEFIDIKQHKQSIKSFFALLLSKEWIILKSPTNLPFCTNDRPGFIVGHESFEIGRFPFESLSSVDWCATVYFVLSPKYCFKICPFQPNTPPEQNAWNSEIKYEEVGSDE